MEVSEVTQKYCREREEQWNEDRLWTKTTFKRHFVKYETNVYRRRKTKILSLKQKE